MTKIVILKSKPDKSMQYIYKSSKQMSFYHGLCTTMCRSLEILIGIFVMSTSYLINTKWFCLYKWDNCIYIWSPKRHIVVYMRMRLDAHKYGMLILVKVSMTHVNTIRKVNYNNKLETLIILKVCHHCLYQKNHWTVTEVSHI